MPELPEVEITMRKLRTLILGKRILLARRSFSEGGGLWKKILKLERRGKAVLIYLSGNKILGFHQRMSGKILVVPRGTRDKHIRFRYKLSDGRDLVMHDVRKFGVVWYGDSKKVLADPYFKTLGPDALTMSFQKFKNILARRQDLPLTSSFVRRGRDSFSFLSLTKGESEGVKWRGRHSKIKPFLLNQKNLAGIGNIMADEILWRAKIHPETMVSELGDNKIKILWSSLRAVLKKSIKMGGSTMRDWLHPSGEKGGYFEKRCVYDREGQKCFRCHSKIIRKKIAGRSSYYCAICQVI